MKVKNIVFSGVMAAILGATSANAAAISVASQGYVDSKVKANADAITEITKTDGTIDTKVAAAVAPLATSQSVTELQTSLDGRLDALEAIEHDTYATKEFVGTIPEGATATNVVAYVQEKTAGIATSENLAELTNRVADAETDIDGLQGSVNKLDGDANTDGSVKKQIADAIASEVTRSDDAYAEKSIEATVSSQGEKITALEDAGYQNAEQVSAAINSAVTADNGAVKTAIATATNDMATKTYVGEQDVATLASAKTYAEDQAEAAQAAAEATAASELASAMESIATAYLEKPAECATTYCVLSVTGKGENESITWMPLTEPQSEYYPAE